MSENERGDRYHGGDVPPPERVADKLAELSRRHDGVLSSDDHGWLQAADHHLRDSEPSFAEVWADYTDDHLGKRAELSVPDEFGRGEWDSVGYVDPSRRNDNEVYNWSKFYDFFVWLRENGYLHTEN